jgi:hypothetical protein
MKYLKYILVAFLIISTHMGFSERRVFTDNEIKQQILHYIAPKCGIPGKRKKLVDTYCINGDTNRMLRLLSDLIATNDEWICTRSMWQYGKYATKSELPFLYSCASNSIRGRHALEAILRIDGVSTNTLQVLDHYMSLTNAVAISNNTERLFVCKIFSFTIFGDCALISYRPIIKQIILDFARRKKSKYVNADRLLCDIDPSYKISKRRLTSMRMAVEHGLNDMQTNYVHSTIRSLESYPEADLPD